MDGWIIIYYSMKFNWVIIVINAIDMLGYGIGYTHAKSGEKTTMKN